MTLTITTDELATYLALNGQNADIGEEDLQNMINFKTNELSGILGMDFIETKHQEHILLEKGRTIVLNYYIVSEINSITVNGGEIPQNDFSFSENGVVYLDYSFPRNSSVIVDYTSCLPENVLNTQIKPIILDMCLLSFSNKGNSNGEVSSISEGDTSVSYNNSNSLGVQIRNRINSVRDRYGARVRLI